jgi:hypothetical protein
MSLCPTCQALMCPLDCPHGPDSGYHWCGTCGCVVGPLNNPTYPAQAKRHAALREAVVEQRKWVTMFQGWVRNGEAKFDFDSFAAAVSIMDGKLALAPNDGR